MGGITYSGLRNQTKKDGDRLKENLLTDKNPRRAGPEG